MLIKKTKNIILIHLIIAIIYFIYLYLCKTLTLSNTNLLINIAYLKTNNLLDIIVLIEKIIFTLYLSIIISNNQNLKYILTRTTKTKLVIYKTISTLLLELTIFHITLIIPIIFNTINLKIYFNSMFNLSIISVITTITILITIIKKEFL